MAVTIRTYATSANLGPLFDRGGLKLDEIFMTTSGKLRTNPGIGIESKGKYPVPVDDTNIAYRVVARITEDFRIKDGLDLTIENSVKPGGLGTSAAGAVAIVEVMDDLHGLKMTAGQKILYASIGEPNQHLDNVVPCIAGGMTLSYKKQGSQVPEFLRISPIPSITIGVAIPLNIKKEGGTGKARIALQHLSYTTADLVYGSSLGERMLIGLSQDDFQMVRDSVIEYSDWEKSVTYVRNNNGTYVTDISGLNKKLEEVMGKNAVATPSGAGTAMLVMASSQKAAKKAVDFIVEWYQDRNIRTEGVVTKIRKWASKDDFVKSA